MIPVIDRYIAKSFFVYFLGGLVVFASLFVVVDFMTNAVRFDAGVEVLLKYYSSYSLEIIHKMIPVATLLATLFTISFLNKSNELVALFSLGKSLFRITLPLWVSIFLIGGFSYIFSDKILPRIIEAKNYVYFLDIKKNPGLYSTVKTNRIWYRVHDTLFNIKLLNTDEKKAYGITMYEFSPDWELQQLIVADEAKIGSDRWELIRGKVTLFLAQDKPSMTQKFDSKTIAMADDISDIQASSNASETMSFSQLSKYINKNKDAGLNTTEFEVDYHARIAFSFAGLIMSLLALTFVISNSRSGGNALNIGVCLGLTFIYWMFYSSGITIGKHGILPPFFAVWLPNLAMAILGVVLFKRLRR